MFLAIILLSVGIRNKVSELGDWLGIEYDSFLF